MTQEDKKLLLKDLCGRLPYGILCKTDNKILQLKDVYIDGAVGNEGQLRLSNCKYGGIYQSIDEVKPYLRPMSSMTKEETDEYNKQIDKDTIQIGKVFEMSNACMVGLNALDWLNAHHFDYRGLIEKGLALEAHKNMYETK